MPQGPLKGSRKRTPTWVSRLPKQPRKVKIQWDAAQCTSGMDLGGSIYFLNTKMSVGNAV